MTKKNDNIIKENLPQTENMPEEFGGYKGVEPTTYGDWQHKGKTTDF